MNCGRNDEFEDFDVELDPGEKQAFSERLASVVGLAAASMCAVSFGSAFRLCRPVTKASEVQHREARFGVFSEVAAPEWDHAVFPARGTDRAIDGFALKDHVHHRPWRGIQRG